MITAVDELDEALADVERAEKRLMDAILRMLATGKRGVQADLVRRTGKSREYFRQIAREHGL
jgi:hypothetical protein